MLTNLNYDKRVYKTPEDDIYQELTVPLLKESKTYLRGVGYFTSEWLKGNSDGIADIVERGGSIKFITSPQLNPEDLEAFRRSDQAKRESLLLKKLSRATEDMETALRSETRDALAWLIADNKLEFVFAVPVNQRGMYHEKTGIFEDGTGNEVVMHGSNNDTGNALYNGESISLYRSWTPGEDYYVKEHKTYLENLYNRTNENYLYFDLPELIREKWVGYTTGTMRPYKLPFQKPLPRKEEPELKPKTPKLPFANGLRPYQQKAIEKWWANEQKGIYRLATGTGKSYTGLGTSLKVLEEKKQVFLIISVPFKHLIHQWEKDCLLFGYEPLKCYSENGDWFKKANSTVDRYNAGFIKYPCLIVTHLSNAAESKFLKLISRIKRKDTILYIADEVHYLGANHLQKTLHPSIDMRLGLSATPERWLDGGGTEALYDYFNKDVAELDLAKAIDKKFLTPYEYHSVVVRLTPEEQDEYVRLTKEIRKRHFLQSKSDNPKPPKSLMRERNQIIQNSANKLERFAELVKQHIEEVGFENFRWTLVYSPEGEEHASVKRRLQELGLSVASIVNETTDKERERIIREFEAGEIQVIVAMKCLDEGVNVPSASRGYFLASTSNPRQFIQRRGRLLRLPPDGIFKEKAVIYDFVMLPFFEEKTKEDCQSLMRREMARFVEFTAASLNGFDEKKKLEALLKDFDLGHLPFMAFEDFYNELRGELEHEEE